MISRRFFLVGAMAATVVPAIGFGKIAFKPAKIKFDPCLAWVHAAKVSTNHPERHMAVFCVMGHYGIQKYKDNPLHGAADNAQTVVLRAVGQKMRDGQEIKFSSYEEELAEAKRMSDELNMEWPEIAKSFRHNFS